MEQSQALQDLEFETRTYLDFVIGAMDNKLMAPKQDNVIAVMPGLTQSKASSSSMPDMLRRHCSTQSSEKSSLRRIPYVTARRVAAFSSVWSV